MVRPGGAYTTREQAEIVEVSRCKPRSPREMLRFFMR